MHQCINLVRGTLNGQRFIFEKKRKIQDDHCDLEKEIIITEEEGH